MLAFVRGALVDAALDSFRPGALFSRLLLGTALLVCYAPTDF